MIQQGTKNIKKARALKYDCLRAVASAAIIMVHAMPIETYSSRQWWFNHTMTPLLLAFVGIYFMLSGMFILERGTEDIGMFYRKRLISVGVPFLVYGLIYYCYNVYADGVRCSVPVHILRYLGQLLTAGIPRAGHLWFMYTITAFYICAPFLARMVKHMTDGELKWMLFLMLGIHTLEIAGEITGLDVKPWTQVTLYTGWVYYFLLGYGLKRLCKKRQFPVFAALAFLGLGFELMADKFLVGWVPQSPHKSPSTVLICSAIFLLFHFYGEMLPKWAKDLCAVVSRYSFSIFLIHFLILSYYVQPVLLKDLLARRYILGTITATAVTFLLSLICSIVIDLLAVSPLQRLVGKISG